MASLIDNALLNVEELRRLLGQDVDNPSKDDHREVMFINGVSEWVVKYCDRKFRSGTDTWIIDGNGETSIFVRYWPIVTVTSVSYWDSTQWVEMATTIYPRTNSDEEVWFNHGDIFPSGRKNLQIVYTYGCDLKDIPANLKAAVADHVAWQIKALERSGINSESFGEQTTTFDFTAPPKRIVQVYDSFKRITF